MGLSCSCNDEWDGEQEFAYNPDDFINIPKFQRRKRCKSCRELIDHGQKVAKFSRIRGPRNEIELKIYGDYTEIDIPPFYFCERCSEIFFNLDDLGFCVNGYENMDEMLRDYKEMIKFTK